MWNFAIRFRIQYFAKWLNGPISDELSEKFVDVNIPLHFSNPQSNQFDYNDLSVCNRDPGTDFEWEIIVERSVELAERLLDEGEDLLDEEAVIEALSRFQEAWDALPDPRDEQDLAVQILAAIADAQFFLGEWENCTRSIQHAFRSGAEQDNAFLHLRLGQCAYETGDLDRAANELTMAYMSAGAEIFDQEDDAYFDFLKTRIQPPADGKW